MKKNIKDKYPNITIVNGDGSKGLPSEMPFDRIFLSAGENSAIFNKEILINQLSENGILIYPETHGSLYKITKKKNENIVDEYYGVNFVPLTGGNT
jgi:protein-L-isoaspartate(D-aspartate) O-methyltransferase